jgi:hypothetical protein
VHEQGWKCTKSTAAIELVIQGLWSQNHLINLIVFWKQLTQLHLIHITTTHCTNNHTVSHIPHGREWHRHHLLKLTKHHKHTNPTKKDRKSDEKKSGKRKAAKRTSSSSHPYNDSGSANAAAKLVVLKSGKVECDHRGVKTQPASAKMMSISQCTNKSTVVNESSKQQA